VTGGGLVRCFKGGRRFLESSRGLFQSLKEVSNPTSATILQIKGLLELRKLTTNCKEGPIQVGNR
jgi:hypothetical protein